jgi:hypothetical protein
MERGMMRSYVNALAAIAMSLAVAGVVYAQSSDGRDRRVVIFNERSSDMLRLYGSRTTTGEWEENIITQPLKSGSKRVINFDDGTGSCMFDLRAVFRDNLTVHQWSFNVCREEYWRVVD